MFYGSFSKNGLYRAIEVGNVSHRAGEEHHAKKTTKEYNKPTIMSSVRPELYGDDPLTTVRVPHRGLSSQSLGK